MSERGSDAGHQLRDVDACGRGGRGKTAAQQNAGAGRPEAHPQRTIDECRGEAGHSKQKQIARMEERHGYYQPFLLAVRSYRRARQRKPL